MLSCSTVRVFSMALWTGTVHIINTIAHKFSFSYYKVRSWDWGDWKTKKFCPKHTTNSKKVIWHLNTSNAVPDTTHIRETEIHLHKSWEVVQVWSCFLNIGGKPGSYMRLYSINHNCIIYSTVSVATLNKIFRKISWFSRHHMCTSQNIRTHALYYKVSKKKSN